MYNFKDKVVLITGASSGIGAETAVQFARHRATLVLMARTQSNLEATATKCHQAGLAREKILIVVGDVTIEEDTKNAVKKSVEAFQKIDILINNAGSTIAGGIEKTTVKDLDEMMNLNVRSVYMLTQAALPYLIQSKGCVVNLSSIAGVRPLHYVMTYGMAKAAIEQFTKCLAIELAPKGVRVNAVAPAIIQTDIFTRPGGLVKDPADLPKFLEVAGACHPMGRVGQPSEVAQAILWLASPHSSFTTGASIPIDGGRQFTTTNPDVTKM